jgi:hypothetical protein
VTTILSFLIVPMKSQRIVLSLARRLCQNALSPLISFAFWPQERSQITEAASVASFVCLLFGVDRLFCRVTNVSSQFNEK